MNRRKFFQLTPLAALALLLKPPLPATGENNDHLTLTFTTSGMLNADWPISWIVPFDCKVIEMSLVVSGLTAGVVSLLHYPPPAFTQGFYIFQTKAIGQNQVPNVYGEPDFYSGADGKILQGHKFYIFVDRVFSTLNNLTIVVTLKRLPRA